MRKNLLCFAALISAFLFASCSGGSKSVSATTADVENAAEVIQYYNTSLNVLSNMVKEKDVNAVLGYMEQKGKVPTVLAIAPPAVSEKDTFALMNPGSCFNEATRQNLKQSYVGLFNARTKFYANFDRYLSYLKAKDYSKADKLLDVNYQLSKEMAEYKQIVFDILSPFTEQAEQVVLADNPLKEPGKLTWAPKADERDRIDFIFYKGKNLEAKKAIVFGPKGSIVRNKRVQETSKDNFLLPLDVWPTDHKGLLVTFKIK